MSKLVRKFMLDDSWAIGRNECWFSDMASQGFHLKKIGRMFVYFEKSEPKQMNYRIDVLNKIPNSELLEFYKECGWDLVANNKEFYIFSSPEASFVTELHTDPAEQSYTLTDLDKKLKKNLIIVAILILMIIAMIAGMYLINNTPFLLMVDGLFIQQMLMIIVELYVFYKVMCNYAAIHGLKNSLLEGIPINHKENWRKARIINGILGIFFIVIALTTIFIPLIDMAKKEVYKLPEEQVNLPIIRLAELEQNINIERLENRYNLEGISRQNRVTYDWSLLSPIQYDVIESGVIKGQMWEDNSGQYFASMKTCFYKLTFSNMSDELIRDLMKRYIYESETIIQEIKTTQFDKLYVAKEDGKEDTQKQIFAILDDEVIYVNYYGNKSENDIIPLLYKAVTDWNDNQN